MSDHQRHYCWQSGPQRLQRLGYFQNNLSIFKTFALIGEARTLDVRMDVFQLTNSPQFSSPSNSVTSSTFGRVTGTTGSGSGVNGTGGGRSLQLAAIFKF